MGRMSDVDILDQDQQRLVAVRVRVAERLKQNRDALRRWEAVHPSGDGTTPAEHAAALALLNGALAELAPLARMLGIE